MFDFTRDGPKLFYSPAPRMSNYSAREVLDWFRDAGIIRWWAWDPEEGVLTITLYSPFDILGEPRAHLSCKASSLEKAAIFAFEELLDERWRRSSNGR